ncbi:MAG: hypothetical protein HDQ87_00545 [Clostridia bacterium]|nr:hypothetical protein [Clostridia bacterium]
MATKDETAKRLQAVDKLRMRLERQVTSGGTVHLHCPSCGTALVVRPDQKCALCFGCGQAADLPQAMRDAYARAARSGTESYDQLLSLGTSQLEAGSYKPALETFTQCAAADPRSGEAWRGLLLASTEEWKREMEPPKEIFERAHALLRPLEAEKLQRQWGVYTTYLESRERLRRRGERVRQEKADHAEHEAQREKRRPAARAVARALIITACIAGCVCLLFTGTSFFFIIGAWILSSLGRERGGRGE